MGKYFKNPYIEGLPGRWYRAKIVTTFVDTGRYKTELYTPEDIAYVIDGNPYYQTYRTSTSGNVTSQQYLHLKDNFVCTDVKIINKQTKSFSVAAIATTAQQPYLNSIGFVYPQGESIGYQSLRFDNFSVNMLGEVDILIYGFFIGDDD